MTISVLLEDFGTSQLYQAVNSLDWQIQDNLEQASDFIVIENFACYEGKPQLFAALPKLRTVQW